MNFANPTILIKNFCTFFIKLCAKQKQYIYLIINNLIQPYFNMMR